MIDRLRLKILQYGVERGAWVKARTLPMVAAFLAVTGSASADSFSDIVQRVLDLETQILRLQEQQARDRAEQQRWAQDLETQVRRLQEQQARDDAERLERLQEQRRQDIERFRDAMRPSGGK